MDLSSAEVGRITAASVTAQSSSGNIDLRGFTQSGHISGGWTLTAATTAAVSGATTMYSS